MSRESQSGDSQLQLVVYLERGSFDEEARDALKAELLAQGLVADVEEADPIRPRGVVDPTYVDAFLVFVGGVGTGLFANATWDAIKSAFRRLPGLEGRGWQMDAEWTQGRVKLNGRCVGPNSDQALDKLIDVIRARSETTKDQHSSG